MKNKKKYLSVLLTLALILTTSFTVFAADYSSNENNQGIWEVITNADGNTYLENTQTHEIMAKAFKLDTSGNPVILDLTEYAQFLNQSTPILPATQEQSITQKQPEATDGSVQAVITYAYTFEESESYLGIGTAKKVTPDVKGPATISYGQSVTITDSFGGDLSITGSIKKAIEIGASFGWEHSFASDTTFGLEYDIPSGKTGYVQFKPYYNVSLGILNEKIFYDLHLMHDNYYDAWGQCPVETSTGFADGVYELIIKK